jgi:hypothetical protein
LASHSFRRGGELVADFSIFCRMPADKHQGRGDPSAPPCSDTRAGVANCAGKNLRDFDYPPSARIMLLESKIGFCEQDIPCINGHEAALCVPETSDLFEHLPFLETRMPTGALFGTFF